MIRVVIDTNVVVSAALSDKGHPAAVLELVLRGKVTPCVSARILDEYAEVLGRARIKVDPRRAAAIQELIAGAGFVVAPQRTLKVCSDPDDDMFVECAVESRAEFLITGNTRDFPPSYESTSVVTPREFVDVWREVEE
ncbi:MAG: putative toxin-antitoxin system toxin component, PIN family [Acidobacteria bacterium]|nr:putative toxin-antitoxin system toxin component, PIN family [Acidobacteriota bacterium]